MVLVGQECCLDRDIEHSEFEVVRDFPAVADSLAIFFCCHHYRCWISGDSILYGPYVRSAEFMMVRKVQMPDYLVVAAKVVFERSVVGYACEQDQPF